MFTGIVQEVGRVLEIDRGADGARLRIEAALAAGLEPGGSVAVSGACLTATELGEGFFEAEAMNQTLSVTTLGERTAGDRVNLELPLRAGDPLGGHIVQGHVDCVGEVEATREDGLARRLRIALPEGSGRYVVEHGSVTVDGVSLTVAALAGDGFEVSLIPETLERTTLGQRTPDAPYVNIEFDVIARYVERLLASKENADG
jgi:riboflavin synthase